MRWRFLPVVFVLATFSAGCGKPTESFVLPSQEMDFNGLFAKNCAGCHGADGRSGAGPALNDALLQAVLPDAVLMQVISTGVRGTAMPAFARDAGGELTVQQIQALIKGMRKNWSKPEELANASLPPFHSREPGDPQRGLAVYQTYCARCHGPDGRGGQAGSIVDPSYLALVSDQGLRIFVIVGRANRNAPDWRNNVPGQPMNPQEISDVVAWLAAHRNKGVTN